MKQAVERIDRIRETALRHLRVLLAAGQGGEAGGGVREWIPAAKELDTYVPSQVNQAIPSCAEEHSNEMNLSANDKITTRQSMGIE